MKSKDQQEGGPKYRMMVRLRHPQKPTTWSTRFRSPRYLLAIYAASGSHFPSQTNIITSTASSPRAPLTFRVQAKSGFYNGESVVLIWYNTS